MINLAPPIFHPIDEKVGDMGPLEDDREEIRTEPFSLPSGFVWDDISLEDEKQVRPRVPPLSGQSKLGGG